MTYQNKYKVPVRLWRKFGWYGQVVFNEVYGSMMQNPDHYQANKSYRKALVELKDWQVIAWNAAVEAAWIVEKAVKRIAA